MDKEKREKLEEKMARKLCQDDCRGEIGMENTEAIKDFNELTKTDWCKKCNAWEMHIDKAKEILEKNIGKWGKDGS